MKMTRVLTPLAIAVAAMVSAQQASADWWNDGDFVVRVGASWLDPDDSDHDLRFDEGWVHQDFDIDSDTTWNISGAWLPVEHWGVELMYIGSTDSDMELERVVYDDIGYGVDGFDTGSFEASYSNLYVNWYPLSKDCMVQPYVGIGVNYTDFNDESFSDDFYFLLEDVGAIIPGSDANFGLSHSWGFTGQLGVDFRFGRESAFLINAAVLYIDADTDFDIHYKGPAGTDSAVTRTISVSDVDYSPWVFNLGVGYSF